MEKTLEKHYNELALEKIAEDDNLEKERENMEREKKLHVKQIIKEQHDEMKSKLIKKIQEDKIEGEIIKRKDIQAQKDQMYKFLFFIYFSIFLYFISNIKIYTWMFLGGKRKKEG